MDKGLVRPCVLTTQVARELQRIYNSPPDVSHCDSKATLARWKQFGPIQLSWLATHAKHPIDLNDREHVLVKVSKPHAQGWEIKNRDGSYPPVWYARFVGKNGGIHEGQASQDLHCFNRYIYANQTVWTGFRRSVHADGPNIITQPDG